MRTGFFGGTFDPVHIGHLIAAQDALDALSLSRVLFVPAGNPPHKRHHAITPAPIRLQMLEAAIRDIDTFEVCTLEVVRAGPSYTVDTLRELKSQDPEQELFLLVGADQARDLPDWRAPQEIVHLACVVLLSREGVNTVPRLQPLVRREVRVRRIDVSATDIRERVARGQSIRFLVPAAVEAIIEDLGLY
ncbi:MAG: nicotinate-nucleotide adenylyltransferase, partial [Longimicrobiales bacterium]